MRRRKTFLEIEKGLFDALYYRQMESELILDEDIPRIKWLWRNPKLSIRRINLSVAIAKEPYEPYHIGDC